MPLRVLSFLAPRTLKNLDGPLNHKVIYFADKYDQCAILHDYSSSSTAQIELPNTP